MLDATTWRREVDAVRELLRNHFGRNADITAFANTELIRLLEQRKKEQPVPERIGRGKFTRATARPAPQDERLHALKAAALVVGIDAEFVLQRQVKRHSGRTQLGQDIHRTKAYAAFALRALYPDNNQTAFGEWVNHSNASNFMSVLDKDTKSGRLRWWNDDKFMFVIESIERFQKSKEAARAEKRECVG